MSVTIQKYIEEMRGMFLSGGWHEHFKPRLQKLRQDHLEGAIADAADMGQLWGARYALRLLDQIISIEHDVDRLAESVKEGAASPTDVVESAQ